MKSHKKRIRRLKAMTLATCAVGLAASGAASAMPMGGDPPATVYHPHGRPALAIRHENGPASIANSPRLSFTRSERLSFTRAHPYGAGPQAYGAGPQAWVLPATHVSDVPSVAKPQVNPRGGWFLPASHRTDVQSSPHTTAPAQPPAAVTREIRTVTDNGDHTLAIVLAACALGIALCGTGYAAARLASLRRRMAGSS
jgi:hypothetical protein